jgi:DNA helicase-2/ATP-dependent DNA helicase PcrA
MDAAILEKLNDQQRAAVLHPSDVPLLIVAGAGTGKTNTLAHRVANLIHTGTDPGRILLLTFTRRAAHEMLRRTESILSPPALSTQNSALRTPSSLLARLWGGTFHSVATRLLRIHSKPLGLGDSFTVIDRTDAEDLLNEVRSEIGLDKGDVRFPKKSTCLSIYSRCVNANQQVDEALKTQFPWCMAYPEQLRTLFAAFVARKLSQNVLDYDDLLLWWFHMMQDESLAADVAARFDAVLVDEYQDTNSLQAAILRRLCPQGRGLTVVGDDAQSIYSFRAATVHNILDFPKMFPGATVLKLEQNYRSVQPILDATNSVISLCPRRYDKDLFSTRASAQKPRLVSVRDEEQQSQHLISQILEHHEAGIALRKQAVLFRAAHHSDALEVELSRRNIPFVKYGGLKFLEAGHVKDVLSFLRLAENPRDSTSAMRVLQLIDGIGPAHAKRAITFLTQHKCDIASWQNFDAPPAASQQWPQFIEIMMKLRQDDLPLAEQVGRVKDFYAPILEKRYEQAQVRGRDVEQLERISANFRDRATMLTELALDPPGATQDLAGAPFREEDYLILSTIHSAKGCEWDCVYVIHAADGNIPSDMACGSDEEIEEERRLFYVALTRARDFLEVVFPLKYFVKKWSTTDRHTYAQLTRFLPESIMDRFERVTLEPPAATDVPASGELSSAIRSRIAGMWG